MKVRRFNAEGARRFGEYLDALTAEPSAEPPRELLEDATATEPLDVPLQVEPQDFPSAFAAAEYLHRQFTAAGAGDVLRDKGLWTWLSLFYFDQVCPVDGNGRRKLRERARLILDAGNFQRYYRHLLAGTYGIYRAHRDEPGRALALLWQPAHIHTDVVAQLASRQELVTNRVVVLVATWLYINPATRRAKPGYQSKSRGGAVRLAAYLNQIDVTWDLYSLTPEELLWRLPKEFERFIPQESGGPPVAEADVSE